MNRDDVLRMAREAGANEMWVHKNAVYLASFASLVAAAEREACAKVCEGERHIEGQFVANEFADAIRARGGRSEHTRPNART